MAWTNDTQHSPYQYSHQASNAFLTAIGSGLGIDTPMNDEAFGELDAMSASPAGGNPAPSPFLASSDTSTPTLVVDPPGASNAESIQQGDQQSQYYGHSDHMMSSASSHASESVDGDWSMDHLSRHTTQTSQTEASSLMLSDQLPHSPYTTPLSSPYTKSEEFDLFESGSTHGFSVPNIELNSGMSSAMSTYGRSSTPDNMDVDWTAASQASTSQFHHGLYPSVSVPNTPNMASLPSVPFAPPHALVVRSDTESTLTREHGSRLTVPVANKMPSIRRFSDPLPPQASFESSALGWAAPLINRQRPHSPSCPPQIQVQVQRLGKRPTFTFPGLRDASQRTLPTVKRKGVRTKRLSEETKEQARKTRNERTMCLSCRLSKVKCIGDPDKCIRCTTKSIDKGPRVCSRAYFLHHIKAESTSFLLQYQTYPQRSDHSRQIVALPPMFNLRGLLAKVHELSKTSSLAIHQSGTLLAVFDLTACDSYLSSLLETSSQNITFSEFINEKLPQFSKNKGWMRCVKHHMALDGDLSTWVQWDMLPTHMDYTLVSMVDNTQRRLLPESVQDLETMQAVAQLFAIISRALELETYTRLEAQLKKDDMVGPDFLQSLGRLLLLLRWRVAWWKRLGTQIPCSDAPVLAQRDASIKSVRQLCLCLYMYYCFYRRSRLQMEYLHGYDLGGQNSYYPNATRPVTERFPGEESMAGFEDWMKEGDVSFLECGSLRELMYY